MRISEQQLRTWVNPNNDTQTLARQLTMAGLEVGSVTPAAGQFTDVVVGHVLKTTRHPNADRLNVCQVDVGAAQALTIVCGAANVRAQLKVAVAVVGAVLPGDFKIKPAKLRGVESNGMICSASELGLAEASEGILELPQDALVGETLYDTLKLDDQLIDIDLTPNRGDCLSIQGVAREVAAITHCELHKPEIVALKPTLKDTLNVTVAAKAACPRYLGRVIRGIDIQATSPIWLQEQLRRAGFRSINLLVDVGNWVMLELGQPLHLFDLNKLTGGLTVRFADPGEQIELLNEETVTLADDTLCIADETGVQAIAGVMGGRSSAVDQSTGNIFIESAFFDPLVISGVTRRYTLTSESAYRFERGVDPCGQRLALERATDLIMQIAGGKAGPVSDFTVEKELPTLVKIDLQRTEIKRILGIEIPDKQVVDSLARLEMKVTQTATGFEVIPPTYRFDIKIGADLLEELMRLTGYEALPALTPRLTVQARADKENELTTARLEDLLIDRDYHEVINYSFTDPKVTRLLLGDIKVCKLANPLSQTMQVMRTSLWPGLLQSLKYNQNRQQARIRLFETGLCFLPSPSGLEQINQIAGVVCGDAQPESWAKRPRLADFFDVKGDVEALLALRGSSEARFVAHEHSALHPGQSAQVYLGKQALGWLGRLHPRHCQALELAGPIFLFELALAPLQHAHVPQFSMISKFPAVRRDIAIVIDQQVTLQAIIDKIVDIGSDLLKKVQVFDIYQGEGIDSMKKSVALGLIFQDNRRTLTDNEINNELEPIIGMLATTFAATLRA